MSFIKLIFSIFTIISKTNEFYDLKYGNIILHYYKQKGCLNQPEKEIVYPVEIGGDHNLTVLNNESFPITYSYDFDFFSSEIIYSNESEEEDEEEDVYKRSFICNGLCYKRFENTDILIDQDNELTPDYEELDEKYKYYSCIYNNIIKTATINITMYNNDKKCKDESETLNYNGTEYCWNVNESYSYRPLYFEDENKKLFYHSYNTKDCTNENIEYLVINQNYFKCNDECNPLNNFTYYKCNFEPNSKNIINLKIYLLFLFIIFIF